MTGLEAYAFGVLLSCGLIALVVPIMALQLSPSRSDSLAASLAAFKAGGAALLLASLVVWLLPASPLRARAGSVADDRDVMIVIATVLAVILASAGAASVSLCLRNGSVSRDEVPGTIAVIAACWVIVVSGFAWLALG